MQQKIVNLQLVNYPQECRHYCSDDEKCYTKTDYNYEVGSRGLSVFLRISALQILFDFDFLFLTVLNLSRMSSGLL